MVLTPSICRRPRRDDLAVFSDIASGSSDPERGREINVLAEGLTLGGPEVKAHFVRAGCKTYDGSRALKLGKNFADAQLSEWPFQSESHKGSIMKSRD